MVKNLEGIIQSGEHPLVVASLLCSNYEQASQKQKRDTMSKLFGLLARSFQLQSEPLLSGPLLWVKRCTEALHCPKEFFLRIVFGKWDI